MQQELLPLFPLGVVLFPRTPLPLHIFEDRYKEMIAAAIREHSEFGVVLAAEKGVVNTGCTAVVDKVIQRYEDGRLDILTMGVRRFEILNLDTEESYLRGAVSYFNDDDTGLITDEMKEKALDGFQALRESIEDEPVPEPEWNDPQLSFQLAQAISDLEFRQQMLILRSETERIRRLVEFLPAHLEKRRHIAHVRSVAPQNGRGPSLTETEL